MPSEIPPEQAAMASGISDMPSRSSTSVFRYSTFETNFFQQGDDSARFPVEFDDLDQGAKGKRPLLSRPSLMGLAIASTSLAFLACLALWQSNSPAPAPALAFTLSTARPAGRTGAAASPPTAAATPTQATRPYGRNHQACRDGPDG